MANDRMYIRCKGCGDLHFLAKCYDDGYFTTHEGEELRQGLDDFFDRHKWCYRDKYYGGFELVYESDDWLEKQKEKSEIPIIPIMPTPPSGWGCDGTHCTNPQMDCLNCPRRTTGGSFSTSSASGTSTLKEEGTNE